MKYRHPPRNKCTCCGKIFSDLYRHTKYKEFEDSKGNIYFSTKCRKSHAKKCTGKCISDKI